MESAILKHQMECWTKFRKDIEKHNAELSEKINSCDLKKTQDISDMKTDIAVFNKTSEIMQQDIADIKGEIATLNNKMDLFIATADGKYATRENLSRVDKVLWIFGIWLFSTMTGMIGFLTTTYILWK